MGLGDDDHAADAERVELVEDDVHDGGLGPLCRLDQGALDRFEVVDGVRVAIEQLEKQVPSQRVQSSSPPLTDPAIYRTSPATSLHVAVWAAKKVFATGEICFTLGSVSPHCKKKTRAHVDLVRTPPHRRRLRASLTPPAAPVNGPRAAPSRSVAPRSFPSAHRPSSAAAWCRRAGDGAAPRRRRADAPPAARRRRSRPRVAPESGCPPSESRRDGSEWRHRGSESRRGPKLDVAGIASASFGGCRRSPRHHWSHFSLAFVRRLGKVTEDFSPPWWRHGDWRRELTVRRSE